MLHLVGLGADVGATRTCIAGTAILLAADGQKAEAVGSVANVGRQQVFRGLALTAHAGLSGVARGAYPLLPLWPIHGRGTCDSRGIAVRRDPLPLALR